MTEQELLVDCLRRLNRLELFYYLTGSMASNYWGIPRTTHDLDFVVQILPLGIGRFVSEFSGDFLIEEPAVQAAFRPPHQFHAIDRRSALKVDFWLPKSEPFDREMLRRRMNVTLFHEPAWITTAEDSILHKLLWNKIAPSERQLIDAAGVVAVQGEKLDVAYLSGWAEELGIVAELNSLLLGGSKPKRT